MKTLAESLFDTDPKNVDVQIGELYKLSEFVYHNFFSNDPLEFMDLFKHKELKKWNYQFVNLNNNFIKYHEERRGILGLAALIDIILCMPAEILNKSNASRLIKNELKPYVKSSDYDELYVSVKYNKNTLKISIYDDIKSSSPNSMKITLVEK